MANNHREKTSAKRTAPKLEVVGASEATGEAPVAKPDKFSLNKFKSHSTNSVSGGVETLQNALPQMSIPGSRDFCRLHPDEEAYWSPELCFVNVPIKGQKRDTLHLIDEDVAKRVGLHSARIKRMRLALGSKPNDVHFLCEVPTRNLDNSWVSSKLEGCEQAKHRWTQALSQRDDGIEAYKIEPARNPEAFSNPKWPKQTLEQLIEKTYAGRMIESEDHPALRGCSAMS